MKGSLISTLILIFFVSVTFSQEKIDDTVNFQSDPAKKFSLYIPSSYDANVSSPAFLALHPLNTRRWNSRSWRDFLTSFAEKHGLILIAPDGGPDGRIDDAIDTAFTTYILDSIQTLYNIDKDKIYVIGFSWGARTTYTYGLRNVDKFAGYTVIGAAITRLNEVGSIVKNGKNESFFIINGSNDSPATRFTPVVNALKGEMACVKDTLLPGIGHTVDFPGFNDLISEAYLWLKDQNCGTTAVDDVIKSEIRLFPNPVRSDQLESTLGNHNVIEVRSNSGQQCQWKHGLKVGSYLVLIEKNDVKSWTSLVVL